MVTMKNKYEPVLVLVLFAASVVNLSNGFAIKQPGAYTASFSGSSSSASAFSHASSSSYTFGDNINANDITGSKGVLNTGAVAGANAVAEAGATAGATASATAGAKAGAVDGAYNNYAGNGAGSDKNGAYFGNANDAVSSSDSGTGCSDTNGCGSSGSSVPLNTGSYKVIDLPNYTTGYTGGAKTNYAVSGNYAQHGSHQVQTTEAGGCQTCKHNFPAPSIHNSKPLNSLPVIPSHIQQPLAPTTISHASSSSASKATTFNQQFTVHEKLPGKYGSIYDSKPATVYHAPAHSTGHVSPSLIATFPGPTGSILDSKPVGVSVANAGSYSAVPAATSSCLDTSGAPIKGCGSEVSSIPGLHGIIAVLPGPSGSIHDSKPAKGHGSTSYNLAGSHANAHPVACSYTPGSPNKCGSSGAIANAGASAGAGSTSHTGTINNTPVVGPACSYTPGSPNKCGSSGAIANAGATAGAGSTSHTGTINNTPVVGPACSYTPGSPNKCGSSGAIANAGATAGAGSTSHTGTINNTPVVGPACSYSPGSPNKCGSSGAIANAGAVAGAVSTSNEGTINNIPVVGSACSDSPGSSNRCGSSGSNANDGTILHSYAVEVPSEPSNVGPSAFPGSGHVFPGPSGSIHDYKPASHIAKESSSEGAYNGAGSITYNPYSANSGAIAGSSAISVKNIPSSHPVEGPACSYNPGSPNKCVLPEVPSSNSGTYYINKPSTDIQPPVPSSSPSFSGQIPCKDGNCESVVTVPVTQSSPCSLGGNCGSASGSYSSSEAVSTTHQVSGGSYSSAGSVSPTSQPPSCLGGKCGTYNSPVSVPTIPQPSSGSVPTVSQPSSCLEGKCGSSINSYSGSGSQKTSESDVIYIDRDHSGQYPQISHDNAYASGGLVYPNEDGSYSNIATTSKPIYKNADNGGYAVSSNSKDNTGILIGPGTGNLPIDDADRKPFGSQGAFGGSSAFSSGIKKKHFGSGPGDSDTFAENTADKSMQFTGSDTFVKSGADKNVPFGSGPGGSDTFAKAHSNSESSKMSEFGYATGSVTIQKSDGALVSPINESEKPSCSNGNCGHSGSVSSSGSSEKVGCHGPSCENTQIYVIEEVPSYGASSGSGVLVNQGTNTNAGSNEIIADKGSYGTGSVSHGYSGSVGCKGGCAGSGTAIGVGSSGILSTLFGHGGLSGSGNNIHKFGGGGGYSGGYGGSAAYSSAQSYASAGSFASANAGAHAGSFAHSF